MSFIIHELKLSDKKTAQTNLYKIAQGKYADMAIKNQILLLKMNQSGKQFNVKTKGQLMVGKFAITLAFIEFPTVLICS